MTVMLLCHIFVNLINVRPLGVKVVRKVIESDTVG